MVGKHRKMNSTTQYTPEAQKANNLRKIVDNLRKWEETQEKRPKMTIYGDDFGHIKEVRVELKV